MMLNGFESTIEFPENPFDAARVFLAVLAYPELGAGQPGGSGVPFGSALWQYVVWDGRRARGLHWLRQKFDNPELRPPRKRDFEGTLDRGLRRIERRLAAYDIVGNQMVNGLLNARRKVALLAAAGREQDAYIIQPGTRFRCTHTVRAAWFDRFRRP